MNDSTGITCIDLAKRFGNRPVFAGLNLCVEEGAFLALAGPSGSGKTTLLRLIAGLDRPDAGEIHIRDRVVAAPRVFVPPQRRKVALVFQDLALWPHMTVRKHLDFVLKGNGVARAERQDRIARMLDVVQLSDRIRAYPHELSGGEKQRVALARALVLDPTLLLFDEPLANLDAELQRRMLDELARLKNRFGITTVYVTHNPHEVDGLADHVVSIKEIAGGSSAPCSSGGQSGRCGPGDQSPSG